MAANKNKNGGSDLIIAAGILLFVPFLIFSFAHYAKLKREFPQTETSQRIFDSGDLLPFLLAGGGAIILGVWIMAFAMGSGLAVILVPLLTAFGVWLCYKIAQSLAVAYYGVTVDAARDVVMLPRDMASFGIGDYVQLRFLRELGDMESVRLSQITKITRQAGKSLYIHGPFGSKGIHFSCKQKRDECIAAIERSARCRAAIEFETS